MRKVLVVLASTALALGVTVGPAQARDTGWDKCPSCRQSR